ncbi:MAG: hypothetical protein C4516_04275 [Oxalobacter sp.]|nr:MAG: hypothetical protein C4516_04275 [Oxalobacter sp.]
MKRRNWKRAQPPSLRHAMDWCKDFAKERKNLSVERIADLMGVPDHWTIYKWIQSGRMPANMIIPYEQACGIDLVTKYLAASKGKLLIDIPSGRANTPGEVNELQSLLNDAVGKLIDFYGGKIVGEEAIAAIQNGMEALAFQRENVKKHGQPEFEFATGEEE